MNKQVHTQETDLPKLSQPALRALAAAGVKNLKQLTQFSEAEVKCWHGIGPNALTSLRRALAEKELSFADERDIQKEKKMGSKDSMNASQHIDRHIKKLTDWRGQRLARLRKIILDAAPELTEEWKWDTPVWSYQGNVVAGGVFKDHVKLNFFKGASLKDPKRLFNAGLDAKATRAIDVSENDKLDEAALKDLVREAVAYNATGGNKK